MSSSYEEKLEILGKKIRNRRDELGLTVKEVAERADIPASSFITFIENAQKQKPNIIYLKRLLQSLKMDYLSEFKELGFIDDIPSYESNLEIPSEFQYIPIYKSISAGYGSVESEIEEIMALPKLPGLKGDIFAFRVKGDSMEPVIENKSIVLIKKIPEVANKKIGAFILNGEALLKRYFCIDGNIFLRSDNSSIYPDIQVRPSDELVIVGQFVGGFNSNGE